MFFHLQLERNITLEPRHFGARMREVLEEKLKHEVRWGDCDARRRGWARAWMRRRVFERAIGRRDATLRRMRF